MTNSSYIALAVVIKIEDDEALKVNENRIQIRIPSIHGPLKEEDLPPDADKLTQWTPDEHLPWAFIIYPLGTKSPNKTSLFQEKEIVYVMFPYGDTSNPVVIGTAGRLVEES